MLPDAPEPAHTPDHHGLHLVSRTAASQSRSQRGRTLLGVSIGAAAAGLVAYSCFFERHRFEVTERSITLARLPRELDGLRVVHVSDFHLGHYAEDSYLREVVARVNQLAPDVVLITGDFVSELIFGSRKRSARMAIPCARILAQLDCRTRWAVLGNHDQLVGPKIITRALEEHGILVVENRFEAFEHNGARIWIAGLASSSEGSPDLDAAVPEALRSSKDAVILLAHEPDYADVVSQHGGVDLMLSGHTHGGQVCLPLIGAPTLPPMGRKYVEGLFAFPGGLQLYVNRGIGAMKLPVRFRCRPEITVITLRSRAASNGSFDPR